MFYVWCFHLIIVLQGKTTHATTETSNLVHKSSLLFATRVGRKPHHLINHQNKPLTQNLALRTNFVGQLRKI